jgi:hypothetical protein
MLFMYSQTHNLFFFYRSQSQTHNLCVFFNKNITIKIFHMCKAYTLYLTKKKSIYTIYQDNDRHHRHPSSLSRIGGLLNQKLKEEKRIAIGKTNIFYLNCAHPGSLPFYFIYGLIIE